MRITNSMMVNQFLDEANDNLNRLNKYQSQSDSTKKFSSISDDPEATMATLSANNKLANLADYQDNVATAQSYLTEAESSTTKLNSLLKSAYDDVISVKSGSKTQSDYNTIATEIANLKDEVVSIGNTTLGTNYIFGGYNYTGNESGVSKTPPFTVNPVTGDLSYNGINLSTIAYKQDFDDEASAITSTGTAVTTAAATYLPLISDSVNQATSINNNLKSMIASGNAALVAAKKYGIVTSAPEYTAMDTFVKNLTAISNGLTNTLGAASVNTNDCQTWINAASDLITTGTYKSLPGPSLSSVVSGLQGVVITPVAVQNAINSEASQQTKIQIGVSQTINVTYTGLDLFGTGNENVYSLLQKCQDMMSSGDMDGLSDMITALQDAQGRTLNLDTMIGSSEDRLSVVSDLYTSDKTNYTTMKSNAEDVDMAEAATKLATAKTVYQACLQAGASITQISVLDYLK